MKRAALFVLPIVAAAATAQAADAPTAIAPIPPPPPPAADPVTHFHIEGGFVRSNTQIDKFGQSGFEPVEDKWGTTADERGFYVGAALRRMFGEHWGFQIGATGTWLNHVVVNPGNDDYAAASLTFQTIDLDVGLHPGGDLHNRFFAGVRVLHTGDTLEFGDSLGGGPDFMSTGTAWMFGPRAGLNARLPLGNSGFALIAEAAGAVLYGNANVFLEGPGDDSGPRTVFNLEGLAGLGWTAPSGNATFTLGYRAQQWWGLRFGNYLEAGGDTFQIDANVLLHGVVVRAAFDF